MKTENPPLSTQESLDLITEMIQQAKGNVQNDSYYFLLWGWVVALANIGHYAILKLTDYPHPYMVWLIALPAYILTWIHSRRAKRESVKTHLDKIHSAMWTAFGLLIPVVIVFGQQINFEINPLIMLLAALPTFVSGVILNFRPLQVGGLILWAFSILAFCLPLEYQYPLMAAAIILGYLIPGYRLKKIE